MALRITKGTDPITVSQIVLCLYGFPGSWKTSLAFTADHPILLDFDQGVHRAAYRKDAVQVTTWNDVASITQDDLADYQTVVVDTAGRALDVLSADIIRRDPKMGRGGALTLQGFGRLKADFIAWLKLMRSFGKDVILLLHVDEQRNGDEMVERIDAQGGSKNEIYKVSDAMGRLAIRDGKRMLLFSPTDTAFGKNPGNFPPIEVPVFGPESNLLGTVIRDIKGKLNAMSEEQREVAALMAQWVETVHKATSAKKLSDLVHAITELDPRIQENAKRLLWSFAKEHDFTYVKGTGFVAPKEDAA